MLEQMFLGQFHHSFDDKSRLTVPSRFRDDFADGVFIIQGFDRNLMVLTAPAFDAIYQHVMSMNILDPQARYLRRHIIGKGNQVELDGSGRILISQDLRAWAELETDVIIVGQGNYFEVWKPELWQEMESQEQVFDAERFKALNLSTR
jgi:MraZ protein